MENGRIWQRGASKGRAGSKNARMMREQEKIDNQDKMDAALQKSLIAETLYHARAHVSGKASLNEPSRPFTPGDMPRHLFHGNDYSNRPGSSYKMSNVLGQAVDEFASMNTGTPAKTMAGTNSESRGSIGMSMRSSEDAVSIMDRHQPQLRGGLPSLNSSM